MPSPALTDEVAGLREREGDQVAAGRGRRRRSEPSCQCCRSPTGSVSAEAGALLRRALRRAMVPPWRSMIGLDDPQAQPQAAGLRLGSAPRRKRSKMRARIAFGSARAFILDPGVDLACRRPLAPMRTHAALRARTCWRWRAGSRTPASAAVVSPRTGGRSSGSSTLQLLAALRSSDADQRVRVLDDLGAAPRSAGGCRAGRTRCARSRADCR